MLQVQIVLHVQTVPLYRFSCPVGTAFTPTAMVSHTHTAPVGFAVPAGTLIKSQMHTCCVP